MSETQFDGQIFGEAFNLELDRQEAPREQRELEMLRTMTHWEAPLDAPPAVIEMNAEPRASDFILFAAMGAVPMEIWKRIAAYPLLAWLVLFMLMPCRLSLITTTALFCAGAIGIAGAWMRWRREDQRGDRPVLDTPHFRG